MTLTGPAYVLDAGDDPTPAELFMLDLSSAATASGTATAARTFPRRAAEARHTRLVAHLDALAAAATDPTALAAIAAVRSVAARHYPWNIYEECDCDPGHRDEDVGVGTVVDVAEVGPTCEDGFRYNICAECCTNETPWSKEQLEDCANGHDHCTDRPLCQTLTGIEGALGLADPDWANSA